MGISVLICYLLFCLSAKTDIGVVFSPGKYCSPLNSSFELVFPEVGQITISELLKDTSVGTSYISTVDYLQIYTYS